VSAGVRRFSALPKVWGLERPAAGIVPGFVEKSKRRCHRQVMRLLPDEQGPRHSIYLMP